MKRLVVVLAVLALGGVFFGCSEAGNDGGGGSSSTGTVSGTLTFVEADSSAVVGALDYYVSVMTSAQYSAWQGAGGGDPAAYETAGGQWSFTSAVGANTDNYSITSVPTGDYYVLAFAWVTADPASDSPDYAGYGHIMTGPGTLAAGETLTVDLDVSPIP